MTTSIQKQEQTQAEIAFGTLCIPKPNGLIFTEKGTFQEWAAIGRTLRMIEGAVHWWLGDWWLHGERSHGDMASQEAKDNVLEITGYDYDTVRNNARVAERFQFECRHSNLSFEHHRIASWCEDPEKRKFWLETAASQDPKLTARELKASILAGHVVRVADMLAQAEGRVQFSLIQGNVGGVRMWVSNILPTLDLEKNPDLKQQVQDIINELEGMCAEMRKTIKGGA